MYVQYNTEYGVRVGTITFRNNNNKSDNNKNNDQHAFEKVKNFKVN